MNEKDNIEELFRDGLSNGSEMPDPSVWENVKRNMPTYAAVGGATTAMGWALKKWLIAAGTSAVVATGGYFAVDALLEDGTTPAKLSQSSDIEGAQDTPVVNPDESTIVVEDESVVKVPSSIEESDTRQSQRESIDIPKSEDHSDQGSKAEDGRKSTTGEKGGVEPDENPGREEVTNEGGQSETTEPVVETPQSPEKPELPAKYATPKVEHISDLTIAVLVKDANPEMKYEWDMGDNTIYKLQEVLHEYEDGGDFEVKLFEVNPNTGERRMVSKTRVSFDKKATEKVEFLHMPNAFTPTGDNHNDQYYITMRGQKTCEVMIFEEHGNVVFQSDDPNFRWDGRHYITGEPCATGYYMCVVSYTDKADVPGQKRIIVRLKR